MINHEDIFSVTQSIISITIVLGGGIAMLFRPEMVNPIVPIIMGVVGFYLSSASNARGFSMGQQSVLNATKDGQP